MGISKYGWWFCGAFERTLPLLWANERIFHQNCPLPKWRKDNKFLSQHRCKLNVDFFFWRMTIYNRTIIKLCHTWILLVYYGSQNTLDPITYWSSNCRGLWVIEGYQFNDIIIRNRVLKFYNTHSQIPYVSTTCELWQILVTEIRWSGKF